MSTDQLATRQVGPPRLAPQPNVLANQALPSSFGDPNAQPPTPRQTPTSAVFPSPVFETPKQNQGAFTEPGSWTPRFAEDYSVFNSTPGNLRGSDDPFADFGPVTPANSSVGHKRLLSAEGFAAEIATHVNHFSPNPSLPLPPVAPSRRLPSSPGPFNIPAEYTADSDPRLSPNLPTKERTPKKARRGTIEEPDSDPAPTQTATPPPTARKGGRKLAPKPNMQNDQGFDQPDFTTQQQQNDMAALMGNPGDMFAYPMSAPVNAPPNFWDASASMSMDMDFGVSGSNMFQPTTPSGHHHAQSFDWTSDMHLFPDPNAPAPPPPSSNQENVQPARRERPLAPKPQTSDQTTASASSSIPAIYPADIHDPFGIMTPGDGVDPGLLFSRPQTAAMDSSFNGTTDFGSADGLGDLGKAPATGEFRRTSSVKEARNGKMPDRAFASSPIKPSARPGLSRSMSENRGKKVRGRGPLPALAPAARPVPQAGGSGVEAGRPVQRQSGRTSPLKHQHRLSSLASIPESCSQPRSRASVKFTIDSRGRARAETTVMANEAASESGFPRSQSSRDVARQDWESSDDESSTDDEPIIIPSRNTSFNASFALPDPRRPVGSIFHSSKRSISDRSTSTQATVDGQGVPFNDAESEAETVMNEQQNQGGDATSELRKVVEDRQKRSTQTESGRSQRFSSGSFGGFNGSTISPTSLTGSMYTTDGQGVRCVCNRNGGDDGDGLMIQCESCEMWLHGKCININRRSMPRVYICAFCANTPNMRGGRMRDTGRGSGLGVGAGSSPLASKSFRSFR